ncbi:MAG: diguanylate cyclase [Spirochaetes bacterium]|nr:diguanylate cyclase [Spirochaetota bacterium]
MNKAEKDKKVKVLVIDDSEEILFLVESILSLNSFEVVKTNRAEKALEQLDTSIDAIILDLMMPGMSGMDFLKIFREKEIFSHIPVIVLTAKDNSDKEIARILEQGANDYITKPFFQAEFISRVRVHSKIKQLTEKLISTNRRLHRKNKLLQKAVKREEKLNEKIIERTIALKRANKKIAQLNSALKYSSSHDPLTSIYNRGAILTFLENDIQRTKRIKNELSLIMFDIDYFKKINDTYGHLVGDEVLKSLAYLVKDSIREIDLFGRYGGEEFIIILPDTNITEGITLVERLMINVRNHAFKTSKEELKITVSLGLAEYNHSETIDQFIERVDNSLYEAKHAGRDCFKVNEDN